ncbi:Flp pilus assembly protein CpaB [Alisedimentitalea sp. MJ-SS2]|uniref:Flp pilus assembly protein CpaB n=1 Tax=Aliisedimentitalea sp. MJ-SS2 TaxID=3049795 RepID=UPI0029093E37|nr:Flp pilus assembly protein CpaB [Alisedimentitalea sp. MJ-SS2]MDU8926093.1 Flp pilus assembly protein CpaB [Alisedimentitalea sp. MJ-SS2]
MRAVFGLVLIVGIGLAGFAVYMAQTKFSAYEAELERRASGGSVDMVEIYVATKAMKYGDEITKADVAKVKWPRHLKVEGAYFKEEQLFPIPDTPRVMLRAIERNEPVTAIKVTKPGEKAGITSLLERGMRAFAIKVDVTSGVSGFLRPGHKVDVYWTGDVLTSDGKRREITKLIEAAVQIVAIDQSANVDSPKASIARTVTVSVKPQQVAGLAQAQSTGRLSLSLVGSEDDTVAADIEIDQNSLLGIARAEAPAPKAAEKKVCTIRTRRGAEVVEIPIPCTN